MGALNWAITHKFNINKVDYPKNGETIRIRQSSPDYKYYRVKDLGDGVKLVIGFNKKKEYKIPKISIN